MPKCRLTCFELYPKNYIQMIIIEIENLKVQIVLYFAKFRKILNGYLLFFRWKESAI